MHKFDPVKFQEKKQALDELKQPYTPPSTVAALRLRVEKLEKLLGV